MTKYEDGLIYEEISVDDGTLVINRNYMALRTPDGVLHPAGLDKYRQYQPIFELIQLISCNVDLETDITEETRQILCEAFAGEHPTLSYSLVGYGDKNGKKKAILDHIKPVTESDFIKVLCLNGSSGLDGEDIVKLPFTSREELREYMRQYMSAGDAYALSEAVRKGLLFEGPERNRPKWIKYKKYLDLLPSDMPELFAKIKYLPSKVIYETIVRYAIIAAKSIAKNGEYVVICGE